MTTTKAILAVLAIAALLGAGLACANTAPADQAPAPAPSALVQTSSASSASSDSGGIWVTGKASVSVEPDLVLLNVGVESMAKTVATARAQAASSMDAVIEAVKAHDIEDKDIQTKSFNIWPQYDWSNDGRTLVGYTVSNTATIRIRAIDDVGMIIDDVAKAGGDATRIDGIRFTIEDPAPYMTQLREGAVKDAVAKAEHFASLMSVAVGDVLYVSEAGASAPAPRPFAAEAAFARTTQDTSISAGELELSLTVQAGFEIRQVVFSTQ